MAKAAYFIHGRGRGHASRANVVYAALVARGFDVGVYAGGDAKAQLDEVNVPFTERPPLLPSRTAVLELAKRTLSDLTAFKCNPPRLVVSDGDHAALLAARAAGIASVAIGHDLTFDPNIDLPPLPKLALAAQRLNSLPTRTATRRIAVHFLPVQSRNETLYVARPDVDPFTSSEHNGSIVCYFRDNNGAAVAKRLAEGGRDVLWFTSESIAVPGVKVLPPSVSAFRSALANCQAVATSAGSNVLAQCIAQHKPVLALYRGGDTEQQLNALLIQQASAGVSATFEHFEAPVAQFLHRVARGDFSRVDIHTRMPSLASVVDSVLEDVVRAVR